MSRINFWKKETGNIMSHGKGLDKQDVEFLKSLKEGDRLILWDNIKDKKSEYSPDYSLKTWLSKEDRATPTQQETPKVETSNEFKPVKT